LSIFSLKYDLLSSVITLFIKFIYSSTELYKQITSDNNFNFKISLSIPSLISGDIPINDLLISKESIEIAQKVLEAYDIIYLFFNEVLNMESEKARLEAEKVKSVISDDGLNALAKYVHNTLGLTNLNCNYDINKGKCRECIKRTKVKNINNNGK
jgi:hypothetical protein